MNAAVGWHDEIASDFAAGYRRSPAFRERLSVWTSLIEAHVRAGDAVLDAGCGAGTLSFVAAKRGASVTAIDGSAAMIALAEQERTRRGLAIDFRAAFTQALDDTAAARYDVILSSSVLEYADDLSLELKRLARVLKPGGVLIVSLPNGDAWYRKLERLAFAMTRRPRYYAHVRQIRSEAALRSDLERAGLTTDDVRFIADPPLPAAILGALGASQRRKTLIVAVARKA